jgi:hypothetical protein
VVSLLILLAHYCCERVIFLIIILISLFLGTGISLPIIIVNKSTRIKWDPGHQRIYLYNGLISVGAAVLSDILIILNEVDLLV